MGHFMGYAGINRGWLRVWFTTEDSDLTTKYGENGSKLTTQIWLVVWNFCLIFHSVGNNNPI